MYSLGDVFKEAQQDSYTRELHGKGFQSYMCYGYKIVKDLSTNFISIINMTQGGDFYKYATKTEIDTFYTLGWKKAIYVLYLSNCRLKLEKVETRIKDAMVNNESVKTIRKLKSSREQIILRFNKVKNKLN